MKDETGGLAIEEYLGLKPTMYSFLVDNSEYKKIKDVNKDFIIIISHGKQ